MVVVMMLVMMMLLMMLMLVMMLVMMMVVMMLVLVMMMVVMMVIRWGKIRKRKLITIFKNQHFLTSSKSHKKSKVSHQIRNI